MHLLDNKCFNRYSISTHQWNSADREQRDRIPRTALPIACPWQRQQQMNHDYKVPVLCHDRPIQLTLKINFIDTSCNCTVRLLTLVCGLSGLLYGAVVPQDTRCRCYTAGATQIRIGRTGTNEALTRHFFGGTGPQSLIRNSWGQMSFKNQNFFRF